MEPEINYQSAYHDSNSPERRVYGRSKFGLGCLGLIGILIVAAIIIVAGYFFIYPAMTPNKLSGDFLDAVAFTGEGGNIRLWILTDGSFSFIQTTKSPGKYSTGRKCWFCKTWTYIYDPVSKSVIKKFKTEYEDIIIQPEILSFGNRIWEIIGPYGDNPPTLNLYDADSGELIMDIHDLEKKHKELNSGITSIIVSQRPVVHLSFKTRDGQDNLIYEFETEKIYKSNSDFRISYEKTRTNEITIFVCGNEQGTQQRKLLYLVTGPANKIEDQTSVENYLNNPSTLKFFTNATAKQVSEKVFIDPKILFQNKDLCFIIHQTIADKDADRQITCIESNGKVKWTIPSSDLFKKTRVDKDDAFSTMFFMKDKFNGSLIGDTFIFKQKGVGIIGFDSGTGKKLWELEL